MIIQIIEEWNGPDITQCAEALSAVPYTVFLDSNRESHPDSNYSYLCWKPEKIIQCDGGHDLIDDLEMNFPKIRIDNAPVPFSGGLVGYFSYDYGVCLHNISLQKDDLGLPTGFFGLYTNVLAKNHKNNKTYIITFDPEQKKYLGDIAQQAAKNNDISPINWKNTLPEEEHAKLIKKTRDEIANGEFYQVNITRRLEASVSEDFDLYASYKILREKNSAPFSLYANYKDFHLLSNSPERFLKLENGVVTTKPIKGTSPSSENPDLLKNDPKERAENIMIVDMLRNDISRVCQKNSVTVDKLCDIETFEGLHHLVSTVSGKLEENKNIFDLLKATLPGGSITGAPKIAAMRYIAENELYRRGPYCGSFGMIGYDGNADFNILIRTLIATKDKLILNTGGGIVADSIEEKEYQETENKVQKILECL